MKLQLKLLVAALALAAVGSVSAQTAGIATSTGSDLMFYAFDATTKASFIEDLGVTYSSYLTGGAGAASTLSANIGSSSAYQAYLAAESTVYSTNPAYASGAAGATQNTQWGVMAGYLNSGTTASTAGLEATVAVGTAPISQTTGSVKSALADVTYLVLGLNSVSGATPTTGYFSTTGNTDNVANSVGGTFSNFLHVSDLNAIGGSSVLTYFSAKTTGVPTASIDTVTFDGTNLTIGAASVAAVPEPKSYMMLLAGLLMVAGFVARRRNSSK